MVKTSLFQYLINLKTVVCLGLLMSGSIFAQSAPVSFDPWEWLEQAKALSHDSTTETLTALADELDAAVSWRGHCFSATPVSFIKVIELAPKEALVELPCYLGAYQGSSVIVYIGDGIDQPIIRALAFPTVSSADQGLYITATTELFGLTTINPDTRLIDTFARARGIGGCGDYHVYAVLAEGVITLLEARAQSCEAFDHALETGCEETDSCPLSPLDWPLIYIFPNLDTAPPSDPSTPSSDPSTP